MGAYVKAADAIREALLSRLESVLATLFPAGKKRGGKFLIGDVLDIDDGIFQAIGFAARCVAWSQAVGATTRVAYHSDIITLINQGDSPRASRYSGK